MNSRETSKQLRNTLEVRGNENRASNVESNKSISESNKSILTLEGGDVGRAKISLPEAELSKIGIRAGIYIGHPNIYTFRFTQTSGEQ